MFFVFFGFCMEKEKLKHLNLNKLFVNFEMNNEKDDDDKL